MGVREPRARAGGALASRLGPTLFAACAFASAFLIFAVQPMVAKRILPWFGGVPAVWTLCLAFYQTALFAGYAYAHLLIRGVRPAHQPAVHALVLAAAAIALPVLPGDAARPAGGGDPGAAILAMLARHVAAPFVALAATGPLVQAWFARRHPSRSPYPLYAVSNLGSFLALVAYPLLLEPRLPLSRTDVLWSRAFVATAAGVLACALLARRSADPGPEPARGAPDRPDALRVALWLLLPGCAVVILMGATNALTLDVASVPFLWMLPLGTYLATFVLCFGSERERRRAPFWILAAAPIVAQGLLGVPELAGVWKLRALGASVQVQIVGHVLLLFGACMLLHGELHRLRPPASSLTGFYLCLSAGGALGGIFAGALAPRIFDDYHELPLGLALGALLLLAARLPDAGRRRWLASPRRLAALAFALVAGVALYALAPGRNELGRVVHQERSFFGVLRVLSSGAGASRQNQLWNGSTLHGVQFPGASRRPTSYYGVETGIGLALGARAPDTPVSIGVIGLGVGTLAAYGRPGDRIRFYEIDPEVIRIARDARYFDYLARSDAAVEVVEGDARISLAAEQARGGAPGFDFLVVDAFSSDAIPLHLLTREAIALYRDALEPDGLLAFHVSNRAFDLVPVLTRLADDAGLASVAIDTDAMGPRLSAPALWVFVARDEARIRALTALALRHRVELGLSPEALVVGRPPPARLARTPLWTDDHTDLLGALRPLRQRLAGKGAAHPPQPRQAG